jgi:hypothetical protein
MTLLLPERPGTSLLVGPCYTSVQEGATSGAFATAVCVQLLRHLQNTNRTSHLPGALAMQTGSYTHGLSDVYALDLEATRQLHAQQEESNRIQEAFLKELEVEEKTSQQKKSAGTSTRRKKQNRRECREMVLAIIERSLCVSQSHNPVGPLDASAVLPFPEVDCEPVPEIECAATILVDTGYAEACRGSADTQTLLEEDAEIDFRELADLKISMLQNRAAEAGADGALHEGARIVERQLAECSVLTGVAVGSADATMHPSTAVRGEDNGGEWAVVENRRLKSSQQVELVAEDVAQPQPNSESGSPSKVATRSGKSRGRRGGRRRHRGNGKDGDGGAERSPTATAPGDAVPYPHATQRPFAGAPTDCAWKALPSPGIGAKFVESSTTRLGEISVPSLWSREAAGPQSRPSPDRPLESLSLEYLSFESLASKGEMWIPAGVDSHAAKSDVWTLESLRGASAPAVPDNIKEIFVDRGQTEMKSMLESADTGLWTLESLRSRSSVQQVSLYDSVANSVLDDFE